MLKKELKIIWTSKLIKVRVVVHAEIFQKTKVKNCVNLCKIMILWSLCLGLWPIRINHDLSDNGLILILSKDLGLGRNIIALCSRIKRNLIHMREMLTIKNQHSKLKSNQPSTSIGWGIRSQPNLKNTLGLTNSPLILINLAIKLPLFRTRYCQINSSLCNRSWISRRGSSKLTNFTNTGTKKSMKC